MNIQLDKEEFSKKRMYLKLLRLKEKNQRE